MTGRGVRAPGGTRAMTFRVPLVPTVVAVASLGMAHAAHAGAAGPAAGGHGARAADGMAVATSAVARRGATITALSVHVAGRGKAPAVIAALYRDQRARPGRRVAVGTVRRAPRGRWVRVALARTIVQADERYWVATLVPGITLRSTRRAKSCRVVTLSGRRALPARWVGGHRSATCGVTFRVIYEAGGTTGAPAAPSPLTQDAATTLPVMSTPPVPEAGLPAGRPLPGPSQTAVDAANSAPVIRYGRRFPGGAYTSEGWGGGASMVLAAAAYAGNTNADAALLEQVRDTIAGGNEPPANGGYPAQHERWVTGMFAVVRHTPRIWSTLTVAERRRIDLVMEGGLVGSAFTTSDTNPYVVGGTQQYTLDGDDNVNRDWNPNYREGMVGMLVVGASYFGSGEAAQAVLEGYDPTAFEAQLKTARLTNLRETVNWKRDHPSSAAPTAAAVAQTVHGFRYHGHRLGDTMAIMRDLVDDTFGADVTCGLNDGAGITTSSDRAGMVVSGCAELAAKGAPGMLKELDTIDGGGARSSAWYAYDSFRTNMVNQLALLAGGLWRPGADAAAIRGRVAVGGPDLWFKLDRGYREYAKGAPMNPPGAAIPYVFRSDNENFAFPFNRTLWEDIVAKAPGG